MIELQQVCSIYTSKIMIELQQVCSIYTSNILSYMNAQRHKNDELQVRETKVACQRCPEASSSILHTFSRLKFPPYFCCFFCRLNSCKICERQNTLSTQLSLLQCYHHLSDRPTNPTQPFCLSSFQCLQ